MDILYVNYPPIPFLAILLGVLGGSGLETCYCEIQVIERIEITLGVPSLGGFSAQLFLYV